MGCSKNSAQTQKPRLRSAVTMETVRPAKLAKSHQAPDSPHELSTPPQFGIILVDGQNRISIISDSAVQILGINS